MKDITTEEAVQTLKDFAKYGRYYSVNTEHHMKSSINKVLNGLEMYKRIAEQNLKDSEEFKENMCDHRCIKNIEIVELKDKLDFYKRKYEKIKKMYVARLIK